jgi:ADP-heptose:LPS heptosyltransferase
VIVHPGSRHIARRTLRPRSGTSKYWPEEHWSKVVTAVRETCPSHAILFTGTRSEGRFNAAIIQRAGVRDVYNVADDLAVRTLLPLLQRAHSMISVDTGPAHAAAALGCPTVVLFGTASPSLYRPGGTATPAVALTGMVAGRQNILGITPQAVIESWLDLLKTARAPVGGLS